VFLSRQAYEDLKQRITTAEAEARAQVKANEVLEANMNWFRHRLTQIEAERAVLIYKVMDVKIPTPEFHKEDPIERFKKDHNFSEHDIFRDMGDAEALKNGVEWDATGQLVQQ
jgi:predicted nuclease with TOPRIM domain